MPDRPTTPCSTPERIEQLLMGELEDEDLRRHLQTCPICGPTAEKIRKDDELIRGFVEAGSGLRGALDEKPAVPSIEGYEILHELHRGGQGVVYEALQRFTKRKVAVKILLAGPYASKSARRRFEREIELVAQLRHPNIISIFESGSTKEGLPYFAMDYIRGSPLHDFVRVKKLALEEVLKLFSTVCDAVQYAHQRGVIHRDLKPSNIIVDAEGRAKVLDFGLAKLLAGPIEAVVSVTQNVIGTLPYMSPEQAEGSPEDVDTRTDVYSLGVILYELLTGHYPYTVVGKMGDILKHIAETQPTPPTRKWTSDCGVVKRTKRHLGAGSCPIDDDVEAMVLRALEKEPSRRYQTANAFSDDIERYLTDKPILARAPSAIYQLRKLIIRHKAPVAVLVMFFLLVAGFGIWMSLLYRHADHLRLEAEREGARATQVQEFLQDMLSSIDPHVAQGRDTTILRELLDRAAVRVSHELARQPQVEAELRSTIGDTYKNLGLYDPAEVHLREAVAIRIREFGDEHPSTLRSRTELASLLLARGHRAEAEKLVRPTLESQRTLLGPEDSDTLRSMDVLSVVLWEQGRNAEAEELARRSLDIRRGLLGKEDPDTLKSMAILSALRYAQGDYEEAETLYRQTMEIRRRIFGPDHPATLASMNDLGNVLRAQDKFDEAEQLHRQTLQIRRRVLGEDHPVTLLSMHNLALVFWYQRHFEEAEEMYRQTWDGQRRVLGPQHPLTLKALDNLVGVLGAQRKLDDARPLLRELIAQRRRAAEDKAAGPDAIDRYALLLLKCEPVDLRDPATALREAKRAVQMGGERNADHLGTLSQAYQATGDIDLAIVAQRKVLELAPPGESLYRVDVEETLVSLYWESGDLETAEKICHDLLARRRRANLDKRHPFIDNALELLAGTLAKREKFVDAEQVLRECLEIRREALPESHWRIPHTESLLGASLAGQESFEAAEPLIVNGYHEIERSPDVSRETVQEALLRTVDLYEAWGKPDKAAKYRAMLPKSEDQPQSSHP